MNEDMNPLHAGATPLTLDSARGMLLNKQPEEKQPAVAPPAEQPPARQDSAPEVDAAPAETQPSGDTDGDDERAEEDLPPIEPPPFWKKSAKELFATMPREMQEQLVERERERDTEFRRIQDDIAGKRKTHESETQAAQSERQRLKTALDTIIPDAETLLKGKWATVDWTKLAREDQATYVALQHDFRTDMAKLQGARDHRAQIAKQEAEAADKASQEAARKEWESLVDKRPELKEQAKAKAFFEDINAYALESGYTPERLANTTSHLDFLMLEKAMKFDRAQKARAEAVAKPVPKVQTPGSAKTKADRAAQTRDALWKQAEKSGEIRDFAKLLRT